MEIAPASVLSEHTESIGYAPTLAKRNDPTGRPMEQEATPPPPGGDPCDGSAAPLVLALVQGSRFTSEELDRIKTLIDDEKAKRGGPSA